MSGLVWHWRDEELHLRGDRTLWWARRRTLIVADVHLGKGPALNRFGIPLPDLSALDLARLAAAIQATGATRLLVLGDLIHTPRDLPADLAGWLPGLEKLLVAGNHDGAARPPGFAVVTRLAEPPFIFLHAPAPAVAPGTICGHLHPKVVLRAAWGRESAPCFWLAHEQLILPAFGALTGGFPIRPGTGDRIAVIGAGTVIEIAIANPFANPLTRPARHAPNDLG